MSESFPSFKDFFGNTKYSAGTHDGPMVYDLSFIYDSYKHNQGEKMTTATEEILYTDSWSGSSRAIEEAVYDAETKTLYVSLSSGGYAYDNVDEYTWKSFKNAFSKGRFYAKTIKRDFGPGRALDWDAFDYAEEREVSVPAPDMGPVTSSTVGMPKAMTYSPTATVTNISTPVFNLQAAPLADTLRHTVRFRVDGGTEVKSYTLTAADVNEAVAEVNGIADALGVEFTVTEVVVHFE